ncbi:iron-containing alcohol dehydrogenase [Alkalihalobacterium alkalinitrilicum]|uniref:iron-containing alcohol dehydrogenase n=1 Tax=Alkalihalobacterium alkalinitrilicum TaxID=427920 RepID=UPI000994D3BB|nr:iron-containing alcohol dehydrogenase [Alkalihalobacterium alkalinitrilicum]
MLYQNLPFEKIWYGQNVVNNHLVEKINKYQAKKLLVVSTHSLINKDLYHSLLKTLKHFQVFVHESKQHVPVKTLFNRLKEIRTFSPDLIVSLGGGSSIDTAKILSLMLSTDISLVDDLLSNALNGSQAHSFEKIEILIPHFSIPTTLSAAEFTSIAGLSHQGMKYVLSHKSLTPQQVFLDPSFSLETPINFWVSTGIRAIDHAVETIYSPLDNPINQALALEALKYLFVYLPLSLENPGNLDYRMKCQLGAWMSLFSNVNIKMGLSHMIGHQLGSFYNIPHGITSAIMLPNVMEFLQPITLNEQAKIYNALFEVDVTKDIGISNEEKAIKAATSVRELVKKLNIPNQLRDFNVTKESLSNVVNNIVLEVNSEKNHSLLQISNLEEGLVATLEKAW